MSTKFAKTLVISLIVASTSITTFALSNMKPIEAKLKQILLSSDKGSQNTSVIIYNEKTYVELRKCAEMVDANIVYSPQEITIVKNSSTAEVTTPTQTTIPTQEPVVTQPQIIVATPTPTPVPTPTPQPTPTPIAKIQSNDYITAGLKIVKNYEFADATRKGNNTLGVIRDSYYIDNETGYVFKATVRYEVMEDDFGKMVKGSNTKTLVVTFKNNSLSDYTVTVE